MLDIATEPRLDHRNVYSFSKISFAKKCTETKALLIQKQKKAEEKEKQPPKPNDPLHTVSKAKLKSALKLVRQSEKKARTELKKIKDKIHSEPVSVSKDLHTSMETVMKENQLTDLFTQLFWTEQQKAFTSKRKTGMK